jgi:hypothetical protein
MPEKVIEDAILTELVEEEVSENNGQSQTYAAKKVEIGNG